MNIKLVIDTAEILEFVISKEETIFQFTLINWYNIVFYIPSNEALLDNFKNNF